MDFLKKVDQLLVVLCGTVFIYYHVKAAGQMFEGITGSKDDSLSRSIHSIGRFL